MKRPLRAKETANLIERFLTGQMHYPQEWNDFIEATRVEQGVEPYRKRCYILDPLVNRPGTPDKEGIAKLRSIAQELRSMDDGET
jgi:hypothetical protein